jgi:hypothetical protein
MALPGRETLRPGTDAVKQPLYRPLRDGSSVRRHRGFIGRFGE